MKRTKKRLNRKIAALIGFTVLACLIAGNALADSTRGITDTSVKIGINAPLSRLLAHAGKASVEALQAYFNYINETKGGVHGRKIELITADHQYEPSRSLAEFKKLVTRNEVMSVIGWGTPPVTILKKPANLEKVPMLCISGGTTLFNPPTRYVAAMITPYSLQAAAVVTGQAAQDRPVL